MDMAKDKPETRKYAIFGNGLVVKEIKCKDCGEIGVEIKNNKTKQDAIVCLKCCFKELDKK